MRDYSKFYTPEHVADRLVSMVDIFDGMRILEPHAGNGALVEALRRTKKKLQITAIEKNPNEKVRLQKCADDVIIADFLNIISTEISCDLIIANPPFGNGIDLNEHLHHMVMQSGLSRNGIIVMIAPRDYTPKPLPKYFYRYFLYEKYDIENWSKNSDGTVTEISILKIFMI
jgi:16S rRNA A1518/A1519 N6-dimethyltransferase RsmA/KsgA/DIM1 with predicted DNA glycosylase/AP lyase activity